MRKMLPLYVALGASLGLIGAYLLAGGASYKPLKPPSPCDTRPAEVLAERSLFEGLILSALDGAACELGVTREELAAALASSEALEQLSDQYGIGSDELERALRSAMLRAIDDAELAGEIPAPIATVLRLIAENAPIAATIDIFESLPGDPTLFDLLDAAAQAGLAITDLTDALGENLDQFGELLPELGIPDIGNLGPLLDLIPNLDPGSLDEFPDQLPGIPEGSLPDRPEGNLPDLNIPDLPAIPGLGRPDSDSQGG